MIQSLNTLLYMYLSFLGMLFCAALLQLRKGQHDADVSDEAISLAKRALFVYILSNIAYIVLPSSLTVIIVISALSYCVILLLRRRFSGSR